MLRHIYLFFSVCFFSSLWAAPGDVLWQYTGDTDISMAAVAGDGSIFFYNEQNQITALTTQGRVHWQTNIEDELRSYPVIGDNGNVYFTGQKTVYALSHDGRLLWQYQVPEEIRTALVISHDDSLYFGTENAGLFAVDNTGAQKWHLQLKHNIESRLVVSNNGLIHFMVGLNLYSVTSDGFQLSRITPYSGKDTYFDDGVSFAETNYSWGSPLVDRQGNVYTVKGEFSYDDIYRGGSFDIHRYFPNGEVRERVYFKPITEKFEIYTSLDVLSDKLYFEEYDDSFCSHCGTTTVHINAIGIFPGVSEQTESLDNVVSVILGEKAQYRKLRITDTDGQKLYVLQAISYDGQELWRQPQGLGNARLTESGVLLVRSSNTLIAIDTVGDKPADTHWPMYAQNPRNTSRDLKAVLNLWDTDSDGIPDHDDLDNDGDGVGDEEDIFPLNAMESLDTDSDGIGNNADPDDDNDGAADSEDAFPLDASESVDTDGDGIGNNTDTDDDNDHIPDDTEISSGLDPLDAADAALDKDSDGFSNLTEYRAGTGISDASSHPVKTAQESENNSSGGALNLFFSYLILLTLFRRKVFKFR